METSSEQIETVQIVKIPVAWKMLQANAMFMDKDERQKVGEQRNMEESQGRRELQNFLDEGYEIVASHILEVSTGSFIVYTLYKFSLAIKN